MNSVHLRCPRLMRLPLCLAMLSLTAAAYSADFNWVGSDLDDFLEPPNWDQNKVPGSVDGKDDNFFLVTHADPQLVNLDGDVDLSTGRGLIEDTDLSSLTTLEHLSGTLDIGTLEIGRDGFGEYRLGPDASLNVGHLALGVNEGSTGRFSNDGGQINVTGNATLIVGDAGSGQFDQSSGTTNDTNLILGNQATGDGTVNLSGGDIVISGTTTIGKDGIGDFFQDGGTHSAGIVTIGANTDAIGTYELLSGDLTATQLFVGQGGADYGSSLNGLLRQSGGTITVSQMQIGGRDEGPNDPDNGNGNGRYELLDGIATSQVTIVGRTGQGHVLQTGGEFNAGILQLGSSGLVAIDNGSGFDFYSSGTYDLQDGILNTTSTTVGLAGIGTFNQSGVTEHNVDTDLVVGSLRTVEEPYSGQVNEGVYNLAGGILAVQGNSIIGAGNNDGINFPGAAGATGTFNQTGGDHTVTGDLLLAQLGTAGPGAGGTGSYHLSAGMLNVQGDLRLSESNGGGDATFVQDGGAVFASLGFYQDGSNGAGSSYTLNGGTLSSGGFGSMSDNSVFDHVGGTHTSAGLFIIGNSGGSDYDTVYNMTGATAEANFNELWVGGFGIGIMNQSDGTVNVTTRMTVGDGPNTDPSRRYGEYNLSGGTIDNTGSLIVGSGNGVDQDAGFPGQPGGLGSFEQTGGDHSIGGNLVLGQSGNVAGGTGTYTLSSGTLHVMTDTLIGGSGLPDGLQDGTGTFTQTGGTFTTDGAMTVGTGVGTGTYNLSSTDPINNPAVLNTFITYQNGPNSTFNQAGGTHNTAFLNIYGGEYNLSSGTIEVAGNMGVGHIFNSAAFNQTGGDVAVNDGTFGLYVGGNAVPATTGTYTLDDGTLTVAATTHVGSDGVGTFNQNGGTHTADRLLLGENAGGNGTYNLTGGILNDDAIVGDAGVGVVNTSGGTHNVTGDLILGNKVTGDGTYNVSGTGEVVVTGTTRVGREGSGALTVADDGRFTGTGFVTLGSAPGSVGGLVLTDSGALNIDYTGTGAQLLVGDQGTGSASQTGTSSVTTGSLRVGVQGGSTGTYTMDGGTLGVDDGSGVAGGMRIGLAGNGTFTQNGGAVNAAYVQIGGANFGQGGGGSGTYNLNGGQLVASGNVDINVDDNSFGILNVAGGALAAGNIFNNDQLNYSAGSLSANVSNSANFNVSGGAQRTLTGNLSNNAGGVLDTAAATPLLVTGVLTNAATGQIQAGANITVGADYNNLAAGNGNAFNHRANVTGAGLILAAGNVTQAITGAVIGGTTASPVLDFGNVRVGASVTRNYQIANTGTTGPDLRGAIQTSVNGGNITDVRLTGSGVTAGNFGPVGIGASSGNQAVNFNASSAGALTGQAVHIANNFDNVQDQTIEIAGAAFNAAVGNATPTPVVLANQRVGGSLSQQLTVANTADAGAFSEDLNASFGANTGGATNNGGSVDGLLAGSSNSAAMNVGVDTATAGAKSGTVTLNYQTAGTVNGVSNGLGTASAGSQEITITGDVYRLAEGSATPDPVNFGNVHLNAAVSQSLTVFNTAVNDGFSEGLGVSASDTGAATVSGSVAGLIAAEASNSSLSVALDTSVAGNRSGTVELAYTSDGTGTSGLAAIGAGSQAVEVSGAVYRLAEATIDNTAAFNFGNVHVGDTLSQAISISNTAVADAFSESLNASFGAISDSRVSTNGGSINQLAAGGTDNSAMVVNVATTAAGSVNGTVMLNFASDGAGSSGLGITGLPSQDLAVTASISATAYRLANPVINNSQPIAFGNYREGDAVTAQAVSITNDVPNDGLSEALNAVANGATGGVMTNGGSFSLLAPQGTNSSAITVSIDTAAAGNKSGAATIDFASDGTGSSGLGITSLTSQDVQVTGAVYRLAAAGAHSPEPVVLGNIREGGSFGTQALIMQNTAANDGFSERLDAAFTGTTGGASASGSIDNLAAQASDSANLVVGLGNADTSTAGTRSGTATIGLASDGTGTSGIAGNVALGTQTVNVTGNVYRLAQGSSTPDPISFGNVHLNDAVTQSLTVSNTAANDGFSEGLNVSFGATSGDATNNGGAVNVLAAGGTSASAMAVGIDTGSAGAKTGTVMVNYASDGTGTSGLAAIGAGSQAVEVSGAVYRLASAQINNAGGFSFGNVHVGDTVEHALSITNNVANDAYSEGLDASFGAVSDARILTSGSIGLLAAGGTNNASMVIGVNTSSAGSVNGTATVSFASNGSGTSGLGITALPSQDVSVSAGIVEGAVFRLANPVIQTAQPVDFGKVRINSAASQALSILNDVPNDGFSEKLNATAGVPTGAATVSGSFGLLAPQGVDNSNIVVGLNTSVAGVRSGAGTIGFASDGTGTSGLGITPLASQGVDVTGEVYRLADPTLNTPTVTLLARVGDAVPSANLSVTNNSPDQYTEALKVDIGPVSAGFSGSGAIAALAAQATDAASLSVSLASTATSQNINGTAELDFQSTGAGTTGEADVSVGSAFVSLAGKVYEKAVALVQQVVDFGIVHVGELVAALGVSVTNDAPGAALNDTLTGSIGGASGPFTTAGNLGTGLLAGVTDTSSLGVELDTSAAGIFAGTAAASLFSHNPDMADLALGSFQVDLMAQVNNYANADLAKTGGGGSFGGGGLEYFLDFGNVLLNSGPLVASLEVRNAVSGPADLLDGLFNILGTQDFAYNAFNDFFNLAGGAALGGLSVSFDPTSLGVFSDDIVLVSSGHNGSGYRAGLDEITLRVRANVVSDAGGTVPEPGSLALVAIALAAMRLARRRAAALH